MISFRYHLVTIVAVFLALALGILIGTNAVNQAVVERLQKQTHDLIRSRDQLAAEVAVWDRFGAELEPILVQNELTDRPVVLVTEENVDPKEIDSVQGVLGDAGAKVLGVVIATSKMGLAQPTAQEQLAGLLGVPATQPVYQLTEEAADALGRRLQRGFDGNAEQDFLQQMVSQDFLDLQQRSGSTIEDVGGSSQLVVVLAGGKKQPPVDPSVFCVPLVNALVDRGQAVAATETSTSIYPFVALIRDDKQHDGRLVTVDNGDEVPGQVALVLGLANLLEDGQGGDYGIKRGASGLIPPA